MANSYQERYYAFYFPTAMSQLKVWDGGNHSGVPLQYANPQAALDSIEGGGYRLNGVVVVQEIDVTITAEPVVV